MWHKIFFNKNQIEYETYTACLIKMPNNSNYKGYSFWMPKKCVREIGGKGYFMIFVYKDDWIFTLKKYGKGVYNKNQVIREKVINTIEMEEAFEITSENVNNFVEVESDKALEKEEYKKQVIVTIKEHTPKKVNKLLNNEISSLKL
jgi:hypothetical protein